MSIQYFSKENGQRIAYRKTEGTPPTVMFCGGYRSDMEGSKATYFEEQCIARGQSYIRFDYSGHGSSDGDFNDGTIGSWLSDALDILDNIAPEGPITLVGSSMGGWMALLIALARPQRIKTLIGIAAAPDFTDDIFNRLSAQDQATLLETGSLQVPNDYSNEPYHFTKSFFEEAKAHMVLGKNQSLPCPVHLFQGMKDLDVLPETAEKIKNAFPGTEITITYIENGDHRLSTPEDLTLINQKIIEMSAL